MAKPKKTATAPRPVGRPRILPKDMTERFMIRCSAPDIATWKAEADALGISVGSWVRLAAHRMVGKIRIGA